MTEETTDPTSPDLSIENQASSSAPMDEEKSVSDQDQENDSRDANESRPSEAKETVDREKMCPFLLKVVVRNGVHAHPNDFKSDTHQLHLYTWKDATLREILSMVQVHESSTRNFAKVNLQLLKRLRSGKIMEKDIGTFLTCNREGRDPFQDESKTLHGCSFDIGDWLSVCVNPSPRPSGGASGSGAMARREEPRGRMDLYRPGMSGGPIRSRIQDHRRRPY